MSIRSNRARLINYQRQCRGITDKREVVQRAKEGLGKETFYQEPLSTY